MTIDWWAALRDKKPVHDAMAGAFLQHWLPVVETAMNANSKRSRLPATWEQLASTLDRKFAGAWRIQRGKAEVSWYGAELMAEVLEMRVEQLTPTREQWLPTATQLLCGEPTLPFPEAQAYAFYRLAGTGDWRGQLDGEALTIVSQQLTASSFGIEQLRQAILNAADRVGSELQTLLGNTAQTDDKK